MLKALVGLAAAVMASACSTVGVRSGTEEPVYQVVERVGDLEIRRYGERIAAQTVVTGDSAEARNAGFRKLAGYIFGGNDRRMSISMTAPVAQAGDPATGSETISMTAPVAQTPSGAGRWTVQFFMPAAYTMETLPVPRDPAVQLVVVPAETYAVLKFSGMGSVPAVETHTADLLSGLATSRWIPRADPVAWFYDPPWTVPSFRRNEIAVRVEPATAERP
ncbi:MAG: hypothetical protein ACI9YM_001181 [Brevundimonas sp.]|jgi:hypothetical protein